MRPRQGDTNKARISIAVAKPPDAAFAELIPTWHLFVGEALPSGQVSTAAQNVSAEWAGRKGARFSKSADAAFLRRVANGGVARPEPETVWYAAAAARSLPGNEWCAGPLFLFAAGHFEQFARLILAAIPKLVPRERKSDLVSAVSSACEPPSDDANLEQELRDAGISDLVIRQMMRKARASNSDQLSPSRNTWLLKHQEEAAFQQAFVEIQRAPDQDFAIVAARLADENADIGLANQRQITTTTLLNALGR